MDVVYWSLTLKQFYTVEKIKGYFAKVLEFTTGLGFYGIGLLAGGIAIWAILGWDHVGSGLIGAFIFKNYKAIVEHFKNLIKSKEV